MPATAALPLASLSMQDVRTALASVLTATGQWTPAAAPEAPALCVAADVPCTLPEGETLPLRIALDAAGARWLALSLLGLEDIRTIRPEQALSAITVLAGRLAAELAGAGAGIQVGGSRRIDAIPHGWVRLSCEEGVVAVSAVDAARLHAASLLPEAA